METATEPPKPFAAGKSLLAVLLIATALRLFHLSHRGLWTDEFKTLHAIRQPVGAMARECAAQSHLPTYFLILKAWVAVFGDGEFMLRLPSALAGIAAAGFVFLAALRAWGRRAALFAALLFIMNQRALWAAQEARPYAFTMLAGAGALWALFGAVDRSGARRWIGFGLWSLAGVLFHPLYVLIAFGEAAVVAFWRARSRRWRAWQLAAAAIALAAIIAAYLWFARPGSNANVFAARGWPGADTILNGFAEILFGKFDDGYGDSMKYVFIGLTLLVAGAAWHGSARGESETAAPPRDAQVRAFWLAAAGTFSLYIAFILISGFYRRLPENTRYFSLGSGAAAMLAGAALANLRFGRLRCLLFAGMVVLLVPPNVRWHRSLGDGAREAVRLVAGKRGADEPVFICNDTEAGVMAQYYNLGAEPIGVSRTAGDGAAVEQIVAAGAEGKPGFWIILYKDRASPLVDAAEAWGKERGLSREGKWKFDEAKVYHFAAK